MPEVIPEVLSQYAEEAAFLWILRDAAVQRPDYLLAELIELDERIEAHLDGLRVYGDPAWEFVRQQLEEIGEVGEVYTAAVLALENGDEARMQPVLEIGMADPEIARGLISAIGWLAVAQAKQRLQPLFAAESPAVRRVGVAAAAIHRWDPGKPLRDALRADDPMLQARALRAVGELGLPDLAPVVRKALEAKEEIVRFWSAWSAALLTRDGKALQVLRTIALAESPFGERAVLLVMRLDEMTSSRRLLARLQELPERHRRACIGAGALGDPFAIPWLIEKMEIPALARVAGEALTTITGVDISDEKLEGEWPEGFEAGPTEEQEDENVDMDADEDLPWPNPELVQQWWKKNRNRFQEGTRYLVGQPISEQSLKEVLRMGLQRQRAAAALEIALRKPEKGLFEVRAPGLRQQQMLASS